MMKNQLYHFDVKSFPLNGHTPWLGKQASKVDDIWIVNCCSERYNLWGSLCFDLCYIFLTLIEKMACKQNLKIT